MPNATDIKRKIDSLDGGEFQELCDAYLKCRGYGVGYSLGMKTGTHKTAKGNPDSIITAWHASSAEVKTWLAAQ